VTRVSTPTIVFAVVVAAFSIGAVFLLIASGGNAPPPTPRPSPAVTGPTLAARTPVEPGATNPANAFTLALDVSWDQAGQRTVVCWVLTTTPPQRAAPAAERIEGPGVVRPDELNIGTDSNGVARGAFVVDQLGTYRLSATVAGRTTTQAVVVRSGTGPRPCG
jgi:hypothetical protein